MMKFYRIVNTTTSITPFGATNSASEMVGIGLARAKLRGGTSN